MDEAARTIEFIDQHRGTARLKPVRELPGFMTVVSGQPVHRVILSPRNDGHVVRFEGAGGELLMVLACPSISSLS